MANKKVLDYRCPGCNAPIIYNASLKKWKCDYCDNTFTLKQIKEHNKFDITKEEKIDPNYMVYKCEICGAQIIADEQTSATFCLYCGNTSILKNKLAGKFEPDLIIPFKKTNDEAIAAFLSLAKGRPLIPNDFLSKTNIEKIKGIYIPFWLYDIEADGSIDVAAKKVRTSRIGSTVREKTEIYDLKRTATMNFYKIPIDASARFDNDLMSTLEPFDSKYLEEYNHAYLAGFYAEKYDFDAEQSYNGVANRAYFSTKAKMLDSCKGYSSKRIVRDNIKIKPVKKYYTLLPVWMVNVKYKGKIYTFAMNGQTGEFIGDIPIDKKKVVLYGVLIFVIVFILYVIVSFLFYLASGSGVL